MKTVICDICGEPLQHGFYRYGNLFRTNTLKIKIWDSDMTRMDICSDCKNNLVKYLKENKKGE